MDLSLQRGPAGAYQYLMVTKPRGIASWVRKGKIQEFSEGTIDATDIRPSHYWYRDPGSSKNRDSDLSFDWAARRIHTVDANGEHSLDLDNGTLDRLVWRLALMRDLQAGRQQMNYTVAKGDRIKRYQYAVAGEEMLETRIGTLKTIKVTRIKNGKPAETTLWCAAELGYLPIRVEHREKGSAMVMEIRSLEESQ